MPPKFFKTLDCLRCQNERISTMTFSSRESAGKQLGNALLHENIRADLVLGLPRGGVVVAAEVAKTLQVPLDVLVVRKIGHPWHREFAVGALGEGGTVVLDETSLGRTNVMEDDLQEIISEETERLKNYQRKFHRDAPISRAGKRIIIVDDGLATGATMEAAVKSAKQQGASEVIVAVPVASTNGAERLLAVADKVISLWTDPEFDAVGRYYEEFAQTTDEEVLALLHENERLAA